MTNFECYKYQCYASLFLCYAMLMIMLMLSAIANCEEPLMLDTIAGAVTDAFAVALTMAISTAMRYDVMLYDAP